MGRGRGNFLRKLPSPQTLLLFKRLSTWWGGRAKGVRSDAGRKEQVPAGRLEQRFSPCPLIPPQAGPRWRGLRKARIAGLSWDVWGNMFHSRKYAALGNAVNKDSISIKSLEMEGWSPRRWGWGRSVGALPLFLQKSFPPQCFSSVYSSRPYALIFRYSVGRLTPRAKAV